MDDDWDAYFEGGSAAVSSSEGFDSGRIIGKGRGFNPPSYESESGYKHNDRKAGGELDERNNGFRSRNERSQRSGSRRGGSFKEYDDENGENQQEDFESRRGRGGGRTRGRGGGGRSANRFGENDFEESEGHGDRRNENKDDDKPKPRENYIPPEPSSDEAVVFGSGITSGINFDKYFNIRVKVTGENVPPPIDNFEHSGLRKLLLDNILKSHYDKPTPVQKHAIPIVLAGRDLMACAQTGSGKTAAFLLPILSTLLSEPKDLVVDSYHCEPQVIIVSPTRELAIQIHEEARKFAFSSPLKCEVVYGGTNTFSQSNRVKRGCHVLVATPGRLNDFVRRGSVTFSSVRYFVLDEADRMLEEGFIPDVEKMLRHDSMVPTGERQTLMFSATFPEAIQRLAGTFLNNYLFLAVGIVGGACSDVEQKFYQVSKFEKRNRLNEILESIGDEKTIVFVETKRSADFLATFFSERKFPTTSIHGDRLQREREEALSQFKSGSMPVLFATAVAARGLDIKNVSHVINYDLPKNIDEYVHRIGRTGRVGNRGKATSFYDSEQDSHLARDLVKILTQAEQEVPTWLEQDSFGGGSGSTSGGFEYNKFGGRDVRKFNRDNPFGTTGNQGEPQAVEEEEVW